MDCVELTDVCETPNEVAETETEEEGEDVLKPVSNDEEVPVCVEVTVTRRGVFDGGVDVGEEVVDVGDGALTRGLPVNGS